MSTLADLAPLYETVRIRDRELTVHPLELADIGRLAARFRGLSSAIEGGGDVVEAIASAGSEAQHAVIAAALRETEAAVAAAGLTATEQLAIVATAVELTLPNDEGELGNLLGRVARIINRVATASGR